MNQFWSISKITKVTNLKQISLGKDWLYTIIILLYRNVRCGNTSDGIFVFIGNLTQETLTEHNLLLSHCFVTSFDVARQPKK